MEPTLQKRVQEALQGEALTFQVHTALGHALAATATKLFFFSSIPSTVKVIPIDQVEEMKSVGGLLVTIVTIKTKQGDVMVPFERALFKSQFARVRNAIEVLQGKAQLGIYPEEMFQDPKKSPAEDLKMRLAGLGALGCFCLVCFFLMASVLSYLNQAAQRQQVQSTAPDYYIVKTDCYSAIDSQTDKELTAQANARNLKAISDMVASGRVVTLKAQTKVIVLNHGVLNQEIQVVDGANAGWRGFVTSESIQHE